MLRRWRFAFSVAVTLMGTATAWALVPHDKAAGVQPQQKTDRLVDPHARAENEKTGTVPALTLIAPAETMSQQRDAGHHGESSEQEGTEFWPTLLGYKFKITDSLIALSTLALTIFTGLLWRSTEKLWAAGERQIKLTNRAIEVSQAAAEASAAAAKTAERSATASVSAELPILRIATPDVVNLTRPIPDVGAYVAVDTGSIVTEYMTFGSISVQNIGRTAANAYCVCVGWSIGTLSPNQTYQHVTDTSVYIEAGADTNIDLNGFTIEHTLSDIDAINDEGKEFNLFVRIEYSDFLEEVWVVHNVWKWGSENGLTERGLVRNHYAPQDYNRRTKIWP